MMTGDGGLARAMATGPVVLDGGLATLLEAHGHDLSSALWSARLLVENPSAITAAHREYFRAGARVAITSPATRRRLPGFAAIGLGRVEAEQAPAPLRGPGPDGGRRCRRIDGSALGRHVRRPLRRRAGRRLRVPRRLRSDRPPVA